MQLAIFQLVKILIYIWYNICLLTYQVNPLKFILFIGPKSRQKNETFNSSDLSAGHLCLDN
jgi:hypothetical protein